MRIHRQLRYSCLLPCVLFCGCVPRTVTVQPVPVPETAEDLAAMQSVYHLPTGPDGKFPANITAPALIYGPAAHFSDAARRKRQQCNLDINLVVTKEGTVRNAHIVKSCGKDFDPNALKTVKTYRFKPATKDGQPVEVVVTVQVGFTIY